MASTRTIPLFPLGTVLFPHAVLPLHIFEQRYRSMIGAIAEQPAEDREFGVITIREGREVGADGVHALYDIGTIASLRGIDPHPDGRFDIVTLGTSRFRLLEVDTTGEYLVGSVEVLSGRDEADADARLPIGGLRDQVSELMATYRSVVHLPGSPPLLSDDNQTFAWEVADGVLLGLEERQALLSTLTLADRLRALRSLLRRENGLLEALPSLPAVEMSRDAFSVN